MRTLTLNDVYAAIKSGNADAINEASLSRVWQHVVQHKTPSWGIITGFRTANTKKENLTRNKQLGLDIRSMGLGFFKLEGHWSECPDPDMNYEDCPKDQLVDAIEIAYFVPGITKEQLLKLTKKYDQDGSVYGAAVRGLGDASDAKLLFKNGSVTPIGRFHPNAIKQAYSKIGHRSFAFFEGFRYVPQGYMEGMTWNALGD